MSTPYNGSSFVNDNKIYAKNDFNESMNKIYKANAFKINKLINKLSTKVLKKFYLLFIQKLLQKIGKTFILIAN